jgi:hypothetical protein
MFTACSCFCCLLLVQHAVTPLSLLSSPELVEALLTCARACLMAFPQYFFGGMSCLSPYTFVRVLLNLCRPIGGRSTLGFDPRDCKQWEPIAKV